MLYNWFSNLYVKVAYMYAKYLLTVVKSIFVNVYTEMVPFHTVNYIFYEQKLKAHV